MTIIIGTPVPPVTVVSTTRVKDLIDKASFLLNDSANVRWTRAELLGWFNDAQIAIVQVKPGANNKVVSMKLSPGARQNLPIDGWLVLDIYRNMGTDGITPGPAIQIVARAIMDNFFPNWASDTATAEVQNVIFNLQDEPCFYVYPPSDGTGYIEVNYSFVPSPVATETDAINIRDIYASAAIDFMCYRALLKDAEAAANKDIAQGYYTSFMNALESKDKGELENNPNLNLGKPNSSIRGASNP